MNAFTRYLTAVSVLCLVQQAQLGAAEPSYELFDLGALIDPHSYALAINQAGQVAGYGRTARGARAFLYRDQAVHELGPLRGTNSYATSINLFGHVAGFAEQIEGVRAFVFQDGLLHQFDALREVDHYAFGINDSGWVVGHFSTSDGDEAFVLMGAPSLDWASWAGATATPTPSTAAAPSSAAHCCPTVQPCTPSCGMRGSSSI